MNVRIQARERAVEVVSVSLGCITRAGLPSREVVLWRPAGHWRPGAVRLFLMLDGQNSEAWRVPRTIARLAKEGLPIAIAAVPSSRRRIDELGMVERLDHAGRGRLAGLFQGYLVESVLPAAIACLGRAVCPDPAGIFGASLGGLAALDTAWHHPDRFQVAGIFSGALWWREDNSSPDAQQASRMMHHQVRRSRKRRDLHLWFQAGTRDEQSDRDGNGVIDAIQDTIELMRELEGKGYQRGRDLDYLEVCGGRHEESTWAEALPIFLRWACERCGPQGH